MVRPHGGAQVRAEPPPTRSRKGYLLPGVAFLTCPCHLPLLLTVLAGTGLAGFLSQYFGLAFLALGAIFGASLLSRCSSGRSPTCSRT